MNLCGAQAVTSGRIRPIPGVDRVRRQAANFVVVSAVEVGMKSGINRHFRREALLPLLFLVGVLALAFLGAMFLPMFLRSK